MLSNLEFWSIFGQVLVIYITISFSLFFTFYGFAVLYRAVHRARLKEKSCNTQPTN